MLKSVGDKIESVSLFAVACLKLLSFALALPPSCVSTATLSDTGTVYWYASGTNSAPAAIRALTCLFHSLMYPRPYLAPYLPALLELTLPGLDANDVTKTTATLLLYHTILCWVPVQGNAIRSVEVCLENRRTYLVLAGGTDVPRYFVNRYSRVVFAVCIMPSCG